MKLVLLALSTVIVISAGLSLKPSPRRDITFPKQRVKLPEPDGDGMDRTRPPRKGDERPRTKASQPIDASPARLRVSDRRRKKVKQVSTREDETTRVTDGQERTALHTKIVHVPEPYVVHVEKPYPVYIEKPIIVEKHLPIHLYITKKETKKH